MRRCDAKHISKSTCEKHLSFGPLLEVQMSKYCRPCGAKHIAKSECTKNASFEPLLAVRMSKNCAPLRREAHFEVKMLKHEGWGLKVAMRQADRQTDRQTDRHIKMQL